MRRATFRMRLFLSVACIFFWVAKYQPLFENVRVIDDDARQHVYWTYIFQDPELFPNDLLTKFFSSPKIAPLGYQALYFLGAQLIDPLLFSQCLALLLLLLSVHLLCAVGCQVGHPQGSAFAAFLFLLYFLYSTSGGLPKSFAFPLLLGCIYLLQRGAFMGTAGLLCLQSLLYPPILLNSLALAGVAWWRAWRAHPERAAWWRLAALGLGVGLGGSILLAVYARTPQISWGELITPSQAQAMPEFSVHGRTAFYGTTLLQTLLNDRAGVGANRLAGFVGIIAVLYLVGPRRHFVFPSLASDIVLTSLGLFGIAHLVLFRLHLPSRYVLYTLPVAALLVIAANSHAAGMALQSRYAALQRGWHLWLQHRGLQWLGGGALALGFLTVQNCYITPADPLTVTVDTTAMRLYQYIQTLPKDVLIAGHPLDMDNIPLFARRKVLANQELSIPYYTGYYAEVRQRLLDSLLAYYTENPQELQQFVQRHGVDYVLINTQRFTSQFLQGAIYYEPFNTLVNQRLAAQPHFALLDPLVGRRVYTSGPYILVAFDRRSN